MNSVILTQWRDQCDVWMALTSIGQIESHDAMGEWLKGNKINYIDRHIDNVKNLEYDCECRGVELIDLLGLPVKKGEYIQKANAYINFYEVMKIKRSWPNKGCSPHDLYIVWSQMPEDRLLKQTPQWIINLIEEECY